MAVKGSSCPQDCINMEKFYYPRSVQAAHGICFLFSMKSYNEVFHLACKGSLKFNSVSISTFSGYLFAFDCSWTSPITLICVLFLI